MRFTPLLVSLVVFFALVPHIWHFAGHNDPEREVFNFPAWQTIEKLELSLLDRRFATRGNLTPASRDKIAIIAIDEASLAGEQKWPFPRQWHADLVTRLHRAGVKVIGLDIGFDSYEGGTRSAETGQLSKGDQALVDAIANAKDVVLASSFQQGRKKVGDAQSSFNWITTPIDELDEITPDVGITWLLQDVDDAKREYTFALKKPPEVEPLGGFAPLCVARYQGLIKSDFDLTGYYATLKAGKWTDEKGFEHELPLTEGYLNDSAHESEKTGVSTLPIWFWGAQGTFPTYSYYEVRQRWTDTQYEQAFKGRIVLVGATATILKDIFPLPNFPSRDGFGVPLEISGVEIHATMAAMLLDGQFLHEQNLEIALVITLLCTMSASAWILALNSPIARLARRASAWWTRHGWWGRIHDGVWFTLYTLAVLVPLVLFWGLCQWSFSHLQLWIWSIFPMLGALNASVGTMLLLFGAESAERRKTQTQMSRIVAPAVMEEILAHPEADYPRSRRVQATILFTDLEGFTPFADAHEPEEVVEALNAFLSRMQPIISDHGGSIDKYIGDSIMAFFGAPLPKPDHAAQALRCAIALQDECAKFRRETGIPFLMRIGVHTGTVLVGSIGSEQQFNYTMIGSPVNIASRLENKNKEFGSRILCSAQTYHAAPDVASVERASTPIRGKVGEFEVYVVFGPAGKAPRDDVWNDLA